VANPVLQRERWRAEAAAPFPGEALSYGGTVRATGVLLAVTAGSAVIGWNGVDPSDEVAAFPGWLWAVLIGALVVAVVTVVRPGLARVTGPLYALLEGVLIGAITHFYEVAFEGIALQALLATGVTVVVMLVLWATRTIRVTERLRSFVTGATAAVFAFYLITIVMAMAGATMPLVWDAGPLGILFSLLVVGLAAFNLLLDFDFIEQGVRAGVPAEMRWYAAFGLVATILWIYLEMLRLIGKLRSD
jgi:uncharacterized YccA/Bax inhibitor family protein